MRFSKLLIFSLNTLFFRNQILREKRIIQNFQKDNLNVHENISFFKNLNMLNWPWIYKKKHGGEWINFPCD
jgi:hypothetical protein